MHLKDLTPAQREFTSTARLQVLFGEFTAQARTVEAFDAWGTIVVASSTLETDDVSSLRLFVSLHNAELEA
jgi:hypothetical protein